MAGRPGADGLQEVAVHLQHAVVAAPHLGPGELGPAELLALLAVLGDEAHAVREVVHVRRQLPPVGLEAHEAPPVERLAVSRAVAPERKRIRALKSVGQSVKGASA